MEKCSSNAASYSPCVAWAGQAEKGAPSGWGDGPGRPGEEPGPTGNAHAALGSRPAAPWPLQTGKPRGLWARPPAKAGQRLPPLQSPGNRPLLPSPQQQGKIKRHFPTAHFLPSCFPSRDPPAWRRHTLLHPKPRQSQSLLTRPRAEPRCWHQGGTAPHQIGRASCRERVSSPV